MKVLKIMFFLFSFFLIGCSSMKKTVTLGAITGGAGGALSGALIVQKRHGEAALTIGLIAALIGGASGFFINQEIEIEREKMRRQTLLNLKPYPSGVFSEGGSVPMIAPPVVEEYEVRAKVEGKKLIGPHRVWMIKEKSKWQLGSGSHE